MMNSQKKLGKRRQLLQSILYEQALKDVTKHQIQNYNNAVNRSEYQKNFCNRTFTPTLDNNELLHHKELTYPLYSSLTQTFYTQQIMEGILKINVPSLNLKEPFKKNNTFTDDIRTTIKEMN
ncbi:uncharacterized protein [Chelonus insularis]|uniref:uncharacterized protein n=1 Tax=Chelonus insularis TaxID=460826 RepID=UPI001588FAD8|nr:uncharacterized protein LOC118067562 [Chelonus insularis]